MTDTDDPLYDELGGIEDRIKAGEGKSVVDRWEFGRALVQRRKGKQLPKGVRAKITEKFGLEPSEITRRMKLADTFATRDEVVDACTRCGGSWRRIIREELSKRENKPTRAPWDEHAGAASTSSLIRPKPRNSKKPSPNCFATPLSRSSPSQEVAA